MMAETSSTEVVLLDEKWIPNNIRLEDLRFFNHFWMEDSKAGKKVLKLCRLFNKLVPITLPQIFHDMNCYEVYKKFPSGQYWSKASLFVVTNAHVRQFVKDEILKEETAVCGLEETHPLLSKEMCDRFKDHFEVSNEDRDYACGFNSWQLLLQIPNFPSMMYQWWLSSSYYLLKIETHLADFYHLKIPTYFQETVQAVVSLAEKARFYLNLGLQCLVMYARESKQFKIQHYEDIISAVSIVLYYFQTDTMLNFIKYLKRMCWTKYSIRVVNISPSLQKQRDLKGHIETGPCKHEFVLPLWDYFPSSLFMREQLVECTGCSKCKDIIHTQKLKDFEDAKKMTPDLSLICKVLVSKGRFCADDQEALLRHTRDEDVRVLIYKWTKIRGFLENKSPLDEADRGSFYDILVLTAELEQANLEAAITERLTTLSGIKSFAINCQGPDMVLSDIDSKIIKDIELEPPWTFASALEDAEKRACKVDKIYRNNMEHHGDSTSCFQDQISKMVLKYATEITNCENAEDKIKYESYCLHFIQYLLPCFLASYFDLKEDKRVSQKARNFYLNFIKQLLKIWEDEVNCTCKTYFIEETVCFLKWKFETVCMDLEGYLYRELEAPSPSLHKTEDSEPHPFITSTMKTHCFDILTDFIDKIKDQRYLILWKVQLFLFADSLQSSLSKLSQKPPGFSWKWVAELRAMSVLSRIIATEVFTRHGFKDNAEYNHTNLFLGSIFKLYAKTEKLMKIRMMPGATKKNTNWSDFQTKVAAESLKLSEQQRLALALYMCLSYSTGLKSEWSEKTYNERASLSIDAVERAYNEFKAGKHLRFQQTLSTWQRDEQGVNLAQVSYKYAMEVAPLCYSVVTCHLTKEMKIQMKEPGEITFCPVRHCRWCGQVETEEKELFVCQFCKDIPEYPDVNLFCSLDCEEKTLDKKHRQEHAEVVEMQLGIRDVEHFMEHLSLTPSNCLERLEPNNVLINNDKSLTAAKNSFVSLSFSKKEPKEECSVICKGTCKGKFHLQCIGVLESGVVVKKDFKPTAWYCGKCFPGSTEEDTIFKQNMRMLSRCKICNRR